MRLIDLYRVELLKTRTFVHRYIYQLVLTKKDAIQGITSDKGPCLCTLANTNQAPGDSLATLFRNANAEDTVWITLQSIPNNLNNIWGGEPFKIFHDMCPKPTDVLQPYQFALTEVDSTHPNAILSRTDWILPMLDSIRRNLPNMFDAAVKYLYNEFVVQCFPSNSMGFASFCILVDKLGLVVGNATAPLEPRKRIFRAIDRHSRSYINFEDLCIGLILLEANNDDLSLTNRQDYIFRFYDSNADGRLEKEEYRQLLVDYITRSQIDEQMKQLDKTKPAFAKEMLDKTWNFFVERNSCTNMSFEQYLKAFENVNQSLGVQSWWLPMVPFFEQIFLKLNCRSMPTTSVQHLVDKAINYK